MKILFLYYSPWWNATAYYGITLAYGLRKAGHSVWFGTNPAVPAAQKVRDYGIPVYPCKIQSVNPFAAFGEARRLARFIAAEHIDIVYTLSPQGHIIHFISVRLCGVETPLIRACCDVREPKNHFFNRYLYIRCTDWLIFPCRANFERYYRVLKFQPQKTSVIYAGIDVQQFDTNKSEPFVRNRFNIPDTAPIIGIAARLSPEKGHRHFLYVASKVLAKVKNVHFVIAGKEEQISIPSLQELAHSLHIAENIHFTGYLSDPRGMMEECTIGVITSRFSETISRALLEFMASGKPVIAANVNVLSEVIQQAQAGMVFDKDDINGMADGIITLLTDRAVYDECSKNGRSAVENQYSLDTFVRETESVLTNILNTSGKVEG